MGLTRANVSGGIGLGAKAMHHLKRRTTTWVGMLGAAMCLVWPAWAATDLTLCNKSGLKIYIALVYYDEASKKWMLSAWQNRTPGQCKSIGKVHTGPTYYYAEKEGRKGHWPAQNAVEKTFCVPSAAVKRPITGGSCPTGERLLGFRAMSVSGANYTFNFNN